MSNLSSAIKSKVTATNNKYVNEQEKYGRVLKADEADNKCQISVISRDGISQVFYNVPVMYNQSDDSKISWFPKVGEQVFIRERNKNYVIVGPVIMRPNTNLTYDIYSYGTEDINGDLQ